MNMAMPWTSYIFGPQTWWNIRDPIVHEERTMIQYVNPLAVNSKSPYCIRMFAVVHSDYYVLVGCNVHIYAQPSTENDIDWIVLDTEESCARLSWEMTINHIQYICLDSAHFITTYLINRRFGTVFNAANTSTEFTSTNTNHHSLWHITRQVSCTQLKTPPTCTEDRCRCPYWYRAGRAGTCVDGAGELPDDAQSRADGPGHSHSLCPF